MQKASITIGITVNLMFHGFQFSSKVLVLISLFAFFQYDLMVSRNCKVYNSPGSIIIIIIIIIIIVIYSFRVFSHQLWLMAFHWRLSDSNSPQVSRTLLSILAVFNNVVWMVFTRPPTSKSSSPFNNPLVTVPRAPNAIGTIFTLIFYSFFNSLARS